MAIDQRADASDASLDHASVVCNTTAIVALDKAILSLESTLKDIRATRSILLETTLEVEQLERPFKQLGLGRLVCVQPWRSPRSLGLASHARYLEWECWKARISSRATRSFIVCESFHFARAFLCIHHKLQHLFSRIPKPSSSLVRMARSLRGLSTSRMMKIRLQVLATAMTCRFDPSRPSPPR